MRRGLQIVLMVVGVLFGQAAGGEESRLYEVGRESVEGCVVMTDGERITFPTIFLPEYTEPGLLTSSTVGYHDSLTLFDANDIRYIDVWHDSLPTRNHQLISVRLKRKPRHVAHYWGKLDIVTPYGFIVLAYPRYKLHADGKLECITLYGNRHFSYPRPFALHNGKTYFDTWPLDLDSPILEYLNRDASGSPGPSMGDWDGMMDMGFDLDAFLDMNDIDFGL